LHIIHPSAGLHPLHVDHSPSRPPPPSPSSSVSVDHGNPTLLLGISYRVSGTIRLNTD